MSQLPPDMEIRQQALHEAISFLAFRTPVTGRDGMVRLPEVADVAARMEHYIRVGEMPLEAEWERPSYEPLLDVGVSLGTGLSEKRCGRIVEHTPHDHGRGERKWCDGKTVVIEQEASAGGY